MSASLPDQAAKMQYDFRSIRQSSSERITDINFLLLELITNSDDNYYLNGLYKDIWIDLDIRKEGNTKITYKDNGTGLTYKEQLEKLNTYGKLSAPKGTRGFFSVGAKDIVAQVSNVIIISFKNGIYYRSMYATYKDDKGQTQLYLIPVDENSNALPVSTYVGRAATDKDYATFDIKPGATGLIYYLDGIRLSMPRFNKLCQSLADMPQLRLIMTKRFETGIKNIIVSSNGETQKLKYEEPTGTRKVKNITSNVFPDAKTKLYIYESDKPLDDYKNGFIITSGRTSFEHTYFDSVFKNSQKFRYIYGELSIDNGILIKLLSEYDQIEGGNRQRSQINDRYMMRPTRKDGLDKSHPFVKDLFDQVKTILSAIVSDDNADSIIPKYLYEDFMRLANEELNDDKEETDDGIKEDVIDNALAKDGIYAIPQSVKMLRDTTRSVTIYINSDFITNKNEPDQTIKLEIKQDGLIKVRRKQSDNTVGPREMSRTINLPIRRVGKRFAAQVDIVSGDVIGEANLKVNFEDAYKADIPVAVTNYEIDGDIQFFRPKFFIQMGRGKRRISLDINPAKFDLKQIKRIKLRMQPNNLVELEPASDPVYNESKKCLEYYIKILGKDVGTTKLTAIMTYGVMKRKGESIKEIEASCEINISKEKLYATAKIEIDNSETNNMYSWVPNATPATLKIYAGNPVVKKIMKNQISLQLLILLPAFASKNAEKSLGDVEVINNYKYEYQAQMTRLLRKSTIE